MEAAMETFHGCFVERAHSSLRAHSSFKAQHHRQGMQRGQGGILMVNKY